MCIHICRTLLVNQKLNNKINFVKDLLFCEFSFDYILGDIYEREKVYQILIKITLIFLDFVIKSNAKTVFLISANFVVCLGVECCVFQFIAFRSAIF